MSLSAENAELPDESPQKKALRAEGWALEQVDALMLADQAAFSREVIDSFWRP